MGLLVLESAGYLLWARWSVRSSQLRDLDPALSRAPPNGETATQAQMQKAILLGAVTRRVARVLLLRCSCLVQSVALTAMLRRRRIPAALRIGVRRTDGSASRIAAHAWGEAAGRVVLDSEQRRDFVPFRSQ